jgi:hypothetical protein
MTIAKKSMNATISSHRGLLSRRGLASELNRYWLVNNSEDCAVAVEPQNEHGYANRR